MVGVSGEVFVVEDADQWIAQIDGDRASPGRVPVDEYEFAVWPLSDVAQAPRPLHVWVFDGG